MEIPSPKVMVTNSTVIITKGDSANRQQSNPCIDLSFIALQEYCSKVGKMLLFM
jgi:hypothetical protein